LALSDHDDSFLQEALGVEQDSPDHQADQKIVGTDPEAKQSIFLSELDCMQ